MHRDYIGGKCKQGLAKNHDSYNKLSSYLHKNRKNIFQFQFEYRFIFYKNKLNEEAS